MGGHTWTVRHVVEAVLVADGGGGKVRLPAGAVEHGGAGGEGGGRADDGVGRRAGGEGNLVQQLGCSSARVRAGEGVAAGVGGGDGWLGG